MKYQLLSKEKNLKNVLRECIKKERFTSIDIVESLKLTKPTVNESLDILFKNDFITKEDFTAGTVGRKAQIWKTTLYNNNLPNLFFLIYTIHNIFYENTNV